MRPSLIGIIAPSFRIPKIEFELGLDEIRNQGFGLRVHPQCLKGYRFFAGTDAERALAFFDYASDPEIPILWCARGGYGAARTLPILDKLCARHGRPPKGKLLVGYSDATVLLEYVRTHWGWQALHAPMPGLRKFCLLEHSEWDALRNWLLGRIPAKPWNGARLKFFGRAPSRPITGEIVGGNLSVWCSVVGTPWIGSVRGKILFLEDVDEGLYRLDRMVQQLVTSGALDGAKALLLGNFQNCKDSVSQVLGRLPATRRAIREAVQKPRPRDLAPLRPKLDATKLIPTIFGEAGKQLGIPVAYGLPVGHGPDHFSLPLGAKYRLFPSGRLELLEWDWITG
jgi:muramoyltetrapeptide carboxypeptidase